MLSRISGLLRDMSMAFAFGAGETVAAFFVAFRFAHLLRRLLGEGSMQSAFIPKFEELRQRHPTHACQFFLNLFGLLSLLLSGIIAAAFLIFGGILFWGDVTPGNREIIILMMIMFPSLLFICLYGLNSALLQCENSYFLPSVAPVAFNMTWVLGAVLLWIFPVALPMYWLAGFVILGCILQWLMTVPGSVKIIRTLHPKWETIEMFSKDIIQFGRPLLLGMIGVCATQINNALDAVFARYAQGDGPALLWFAVRLQQLPLALFGIALSGAILPPLSRAIKANDLDKYKKFLIYGIQLTLLIMIPMSIGLHFLGGNFIDIIYAHGNFTAESTLAATPCLQAYAFGLIPMALVLVLAPGFYAKGQFALTTCASVFSMVLNVVLNAIFVFWFEWGAVSIALATSISAWANALILGIALAFQTQR